jgi:hypothetical protein
MSRKINTARNRIRRNETCTDRSMKTTHEKEKKIGREKNEKRRKEEDRKLNAETTEQEIKT